MPVRFGARGPFGMRFGEEVGSEDHAWSRGKTESESCQRKGDRPRGGFRLPWARCQADAWEAQLGAHARDRLTQWPRVITNNSQCSSRFEEGSLSYEFSPTLS